MDAKRGFVPEDARDFSDEALTTLRSASADVRYLLNAGYDMKSSSTFVGNHFQLSSRQRLAIMRSVSSDRQISLRKEKLAEEKELKGRTLSIDGFNTIITLEVLACGSPLFQCMDGAVRDLAALRGTYRLIPETRQAVVTMLGELRRAGAAGAEILLDEPVSNSGRLKTFIAETSEETAGPNAPLDLDIRICRNVDRMLYGRELVITSDSVIMDKCRSWYDLTGRAVERAGADLIRVWE
ncbi:MAG: DUF434 domain-containing protein [Anaerovoracaceae bacterium]|jgi:hypothetical protein